MTIAGAAGAIAEVVGEMGTRGGGTTALDFFGMTGAAGTGLAAAGGKIGAAAGAGAGAGVAVTAGAETDDGIGFGMADVTEVTGGGRFLVVAVGASVGGLGRAGAASSFCVRGGGGGRMDAVLLSTPAGGAGGAPVARGLGGMVVVAGLAAAGFATGVGTGGADAGADLTSNACVTASEAALTGRSTRRSEPVGFLT